MAATASSSTLPANPQIPTSGAINNFTAPKFNFQPNILDSSPNYTYHIRWSMCTESDSQELIKNGSSSQFRNNINKVIIAESGKTAQYNITDFSISTNLPASPTTPQTTEVTAEMTIVEPYGLSLPDNLFIASREIGVQNYLTSHCYFIDIWFKGYNEDGTVNSLLDSVYKCWAVSLVTLDSTTTESGTTYKLKFLMTNMYGNADHVNCLPNGFTIEAKTVGEFLEKLAPQWTSKNAELYEDKIPRITYKFNYALVKDWKFDTKPTTSQAGNSMTIGSTGVPSFQLGRGTDLVTILNFMLSSTKDHQNFTVGNQSSGSASMGAGSVKTNGMVNLVIIHSLTYNEFPYDTKINDYHRVVTYTLIPYTTTKAIPDLKIAKMIKDSENNAARQAALLSSLNFVKHYYWTYTGQNTDISKFELTLHHTSQSGIINELGYNTIDNFRVGPQIDNSSVGVALQQNLNGTTPSNVASVNTASATGLQNDVNLNTNPTNVKQQITASQSPAAVAAQQGSHIADQAAVAGRADAKAAVAKATGQTTNNTTPPPNVVLRRSSYLEDVGTSLFQPDPWIISGRALVTPLGQEVGQGGTSAHTDKDRQASADNIPVSRSLVANILNQCKDAGLANQKLTIRGDPYWLGFSNIDENNLIGDGTAPPPAGREQSAWWFGGDCGYVFTMRTGTNYNETTGLMDLNTNTIMWNGFYKVIKLTSEFKNGVFSQNLEALRDPLSNPPDTFKQDSTDAKQSSAAEATTETNKQSASLIDEAGKKVQAQLKQGGVATSNNNAQTVDYTAGIY